MEGAEWRMPEAKREASDGHCLRPVDHPYGRPADGRGRIGPMALRWPGAEGSDIG